MSAYCPLFDKCQQGGMRGIYRNIREGLVRHRNPDKKLRHKPGS